MTDNPPPKFVAYPRPSFADYGTDERLQELAKAYFGLSLAMLVNILLSIVAFACATAWGGLGALGAFAIYLLAMAVMVSTQTHRVAAGKGWKKSTGIIASVLMIVTSPICFGLIGHVALQAIALQEIKKYGIQPGMWGLRKKDIQEALLKRHKPKTGFMEPY